jgi:CelD/BcsL family acetyltransferase involved in cellulose biosynthesis
MRGLQLAQGVSRRERPAANRFGISLAPLGGLLEARESWSALAERSGNIFSTWDWAELWWRHFEVAGALSLTAVRSDGQTVALLPTYRGRRSGVPIVRFLGHGAADELGPVCDPLDRALAADALRRSLGRDAVLLAERMPSDFDWADGLGGVPLVEETSPIIDISQEGDWESYLRARSTNFRQQVRRRARRLHRGLGVRFRLADAGRLDRDLDALLLLHDRRWGSDSRAFRSREGFHRAFAARALEAGWLRLWLAEADGEPVAAWYGFRFAGVEFYYQAGRDPSWDRYSIGAGILEHSIREAFEDGMREYRLLRGAEHYKRRYETREAAVCTVAAGRGALMRAAVNTAGAMARSDRGRKILRPLGRSIVAER